MMAAPLLWAAFALAGAAPDVAQTCRDRQQQPAQAVQACQAAYTAAVAAGDRSTADEVLLRQVDAELALGDFGAARRLLDQAERAVQPPAGMQAYRVARRRGILAYRQDAVGDALAQFRQAREMAVAIGDTKAQAQSWNDEGNALRRLGSYREALQAYLTSLDLQRQLGSEQLGPVLNNLGDLYRDLGDPASAAARYQEALADHEAHGRALDIAHTLEGLAASAMDAGDHPAAKRHLDRALGTFRQKQARADELRVGIALARLALDTGDLPAARESLAASERLAVTLGIGVNAGLAQEQARLALATGDAPSAAARLAATLAALPPDAPERASLLSLEAKAAAAAGDYQAAYARALAYQAADAARRDAEHDRRLEQLRVRFEVAEKERALATLAAESHLRESRLRQRTAQLWLTASLSALGFIVVAFGVYRYRERSRLAAARREAVLAAEAAHYREAAAALELDRRRVQSLLDRGATALLALDAGGAVIAANTAATALLSPAGPVIGCTLADLLDADSRRQLEQALGRIDEGEGPADVSLTVRGGTVMHRVRLAAADAVEGMAVVTWLPGPQGAAVKDATIYDTLPDDPESALGVASVALQVDTALLRIAADVEPFASAGDTTDDALDDSGADGFRRELVELMVCAVSAWEESTGKTRIDLAEKSRVWRVTVDDGRLRVRAMERYLTLARLPRQPRWREVLRTAFYVLAECRLDAGVRERLRSLADAVQAAVRRRALS
ncbi:tetratricopeptide repeat protein [Tahibacter amnicola]|uniref:Tetratricopeptide repeat protein n=1 Tax=Tahibacter amnicola TaxID=2976241 RepID=A0ABY6BM23_9GAMM|nr:tetratricopeptide repeat protein [Tahibacter amnicola]UXI68862.1 tetratricopeptide repeat protein [Tahibacter amnicola]